MAKLNVFNFMTLDGYYKGLNGDISWHSHGGEEAGYSAEASQRGGRLVFGRITYELMASFWPTPMAAEQFPIVADGMNKAEKIVFSKTLQSSDWQGTTIIRDDLVGNMKQLKASGPDLTILGSGSIVTQMADAGLIDSYTFMIDPVAIGQGASVFSGLQHRLDLHLDSTRIFSSGVLLVQYTPVRK